MKIKIYGPERDKLANLINKNYPEFKILSQQNKQKADFVICYGGDGTLLLAERLNPGIPKVGIRNSQICDVCGGETSKNILNLLAKRNYHITEHYKIEAKCKGHKIVALNDIIVGHYYINTALRFKVFIDNLQYGSEFLGDSVVVATPIGSTGYYQAITHSNFQEGIGIAFSNTVNNIGHIVLNESVDICVEVTRGPGRVRYDNDRSSIPLQQGDKIYIKKSNQVSRLINFNEKNQKYNIDISHNRLPLGYCQICRKYYL